MALKRRKSSTLSLSCILTYTAVIPELLRQRWVSSSVLAQQPSVYKTLREVKDIKTLYHYIIY